MRDQTRQRVTGFLLSAAALVALPAVARAQADTGTAQVQQDSAATDTTSQDSTKWGYDTNRNPEAQNPPGYRGMERPANLPPADSGQDTSAAAVEDRATGTYNDSTWQDTTGAAQNPPGYRGMERAAGQDTSAQQADSGSAAVQTDTAATRPGSTDPRQSGTPEQRLDPTDTSGTGTDAGTAAGTGDSAGVMPGSTSPVKPDQPRDRLEPGDSADQESR